MATASTSNGVAGCQFTRHESVTKNISGGVPKTFNLSSDDFYVLIASSIYPGADTGGFNIELLDTVYYDFVFKRMQNFAPLPPGFAFAILPCRLY